MDSKKELVAILARLDQLASAEEHAGNCDAAELLASIAEHTEHVLGLLEVAQAPVRHEWHGFA
jgi:hypothetical protein